MLCIGALTELAFMQEDPYGKKRKAVRSSHVFELVCEAWYTWA